MTDWEWWFAQPNRAELVSVIRKHLAGAVSTPPLDIDVAVESIIATCASFQEQQGDFSHPGDECSRVVRETIIQALNGAASTPRCPKCPKCGGEIGGVRVDDLGGVYVECQGVCQKQYEIYHSDDFAQFFQPDSQPSPACREESCFVNGVHDESKCGWHKPQPSPEDQ